MHSSRMRTARSLTMEGGSTCLGVEPAQGAVPAQRGCTCPAGVLPGGVPAWGWGCTCLGGVPTCGGMYLSRGACTCPGGEGWGVPAKGGVPVQGVYLPGGVPAQKGGVLTQGVYLLRKGTCLLPPLWIEFLTHATENITLPQLRCGR